MELDAAAAGSFAGTIHLLSNDADEGSFDIGLSGTVNQPVVRVPEIRVWGNGVELTSGDAVSFGSPLVGTPVTETFTIQNVGDGDLALSPVDPSSLPAGFSLMQGLGPKPEKNGCTRIPKSPRQCLSRGVSSMS